MRNTFHTASDAFHDLYWRIVRDGVDFAGTKALFNVGFEIEVPNANAILDRKVKRNWSYTYAEAEWQWYLSGDPNIKTIITKATIDLNISFIPMALLHLILV